VKPAHCTRTTAGRTRPARAAGFTLIELLVALFISAILFAMGYGALSQALNNRQQVEDAGKRLLAVQQAMRMLEQDFELMQPRPVRDLLGNGYLAPLVYNANALTAQSGVGNAPGTVLHANQQSLALVQFTRGGWANPAGVPRSELQRVSYLVRDRKLVRQYLPVLDADGSVVLQERELLDDVESFSLRFLDGNGNLTWQNAWPTQLVQAGPPQDQLRMRPVAVEVTLKLKDWGVLTRVIEVAG
jgi:general secretion pathway protein J